MTRRERLKKLLDRRKQQERIIIVHFDPHGGPEIRPIVIGGTPAQRDAILAKWDAEHPNIPQPTGPWARASEASPGTAPVTAQAIQQAVAAATGHDQPVVDSGAHPGAPAPSGQLKCRCGAVVEGTAGGRITCRLCGTVFRD